MLVLVSYDVKTSSDDGQGRLSRVAKICQDFGQRVQNSVFECDVDPAQFVELKNRLETIINPEEDSLRYYDLGSNWQRRVEHIGAKPKLDLRNDPLVV